jgi:GalNAc-alpha-(1->4)-GalNAc-alpha-(1->3)-diNAcBac-PP-undecaprenol alpha-1,4-N-acetyl-D-galactosaminyltransferase
MKGKSKICLIIPSLHAGGMERVMSELANYFCKEITIEVHLIILSKKKHFYKLDSNIIVHEPSFNIIGLLGTLKLIRYLRMKIIEISPNSILSFGEMYNSFVLISLLGLKQKIFVSDRSKPDKDWGFLHNNLRVILYKKAFGIISQTNYAAEFIKNKIKHSNINVIGNPFNLNNSEKILSRKNIILTVGRMIKSKQHEHLIQIFNQIEIPGWELHFVGDGPEKQNLLDLTAKLKIQDKVIFHGNQKNVADFYNSSKIFAFASNSEGFPNVLGEAMSKGVVPISYNFIAGATDLITDNVNGCLIELNNQQMFKEKMEELMINENKIISLSNNAIESMNKFDINIISKEYLNVLTENEKI